VVEPPSLPVLSAPVWLVLVEPPPPPDPVLALAVPGVVVDDSMPPAAVAVVVVPLPASLEEQLERLRIAIAESSARM
jgi:hypothetical protein